MHEKFKMITKHDLEGNRVYDTKSSINNRKQQGNREGNSLKACPSRI
jgi:hypothetical protein